MAKSNFLSAKSKLSIAVSLASASLISNAWGQDAEGATEDENNLAIEEIFITATKRPTALSDLPQAAQALSGEDLAKLGTDSFQDFARAVPSLSSISTAPGRNEIVFRGISTGSSNLRTDSGGAVYLDQVAMTSAAQQVDPHVIDIARVEALPGPQGTIFGSGAQSGAIAYITNKPDTNGFYGEIEADYTDITQGSNSTTVQGWVNLPVTDNFALRLSAWDVDQGGYIDNVLGETPFADKTPADIRNNASVVKEDYNTWEKRGARLLARWEMSENWTLDGYIETNSSTSKGDGASDPALNGDFEIVRFFEDVRTDDWTATALTLTGDLGANRVQLLGNVATGLEDTGGFHCGFQFFHQARGFSVVFTG